METPLLELAKLVCPLRGRHWHVGLLAGILGVALIGLSDVTYQPTSLLLVVPGLELSHRQLVLHTTDIAQGSFHTA